MNTNVINILIVCVCLGFSSCTDKPPQTVESPPTVEEPQTNEQPQTNEEMQTIERRVKDSISKPLGLDGMAVGFAASEGSCYRLCKDLVAEYPLEKLEKLVESNDSYVRCAGMICLSNDVEKYKEIILSHGTDETVTYTPVGCIVEKITVKGFAEALVNDKQFRLCYIGDARDLKKMFDKTESD